MGDRRVLNPARRASIVCAAIAATAAPAVVSCELIGGFEPFLGTGGFATTSTASSSTASSGGPPGCAGDSPDAGGSRMVLQKLAGGACFWIDVTEVTVAEYQSFLGTADASTQDDPCGSGQNPSFAPSCDGGTPALGPSEPVVCVDWCDARAYCNSIAKRLCRGDGLLNFGSAATSEWYAACSPDGGAYPYGQSYAGQVCNGRDNPNTGCLAACSLVDAGSLTGCHTASGIFDMSGNANEWTDECDSSDPSAKCATRGGSAQSDSSGLRCNQIAGAARLATHPFTGFRCCADAL
jgi:formylglycine-generating enzyme required for sulfatase activity